jgi:hypothetical protein
MTSMPASVEMSNLLRRATLFVVRAFCACCEAVCAARLAVLVPTAATPFMFSVWPEVLVGRPVEVTELRLLCCV